LRILHMGIREPVTLTKAAMGGEEAFISHPDRELLKVHDPEKFGCTPCHGGNGVALTSVEKAHGYNEHWLWPLHAKENLEAGCQQCHSQEIVTEMAPRWMPDARSSACAAAWACHRYEGFDRDPDALSVGQPGHRQLTQQKAEWTREIGFTTTKGDNYPDNDEAQKYYQHANDLKVRISGLDAKIEQDDDRARSLVREIKKVGPSLKEVRMEDAQGMLPEWLKDPHKWRPGTKMPTFRLDEVKFMPYSAFIWQSGVTGDLPQQRPAIPRREGSLRDARLHGLPFDGEEMPKSRAARSPRI